MTMQRQAVRQDILKITLALLDEGGLAAVKARTIAKKADISVGSIYNLVGNLDALLEMTSAKILDDFAKELHKALATAPPFPPPEGPVDAAAIKTRLIILAHAYMSFIERFEQRWQAILSFNRDRKNTAAGWYTEQQNALFEHIGKIIDTTRLGQDRERRQTAARALWASVHGIISMGYMGQMNETARKLTENQIDFLVTHIVAGLDDSKNGRING